MIQGPWPDTRQRNLSKLQLSRAINRSPKTIERYMAAKMPHGRTTEGHARFCLAECREWIDARDERRSA